MARSSLPESCVPHFKNASAFRRNGVLASASRFMPDCCECILNSSVRMQRRMLVDRTLETEDQDALRFLTKVKERVERQARQLLCDIQSPNLTSVRMVCSRQQEL